MSEQRGWIQTCLCSVWFLYFGTVQDPRLGNGATQGGQIFWSSTSINTITAIYSDSGHTNRETNWESPLWWKDFFSMTLDCVKWMINTNSHTKYPASFLIAKDRGFLCVKAWVLFPTLVPDVAPVRPLYNEEKHRPAILYHHAWDSVVSKGDRDQTSWKSQRFPMEFTSAFHSTKHKYLSIHKQDISK